MKRNDNNIDERSDSSRGESWCVGKRSIEEIITHRPHRILELLCTKDSVLMPALLDRLTSNKIPVTVSGKDEFMARNPEFELLNHQWIAARITPAASMQYHQVFEKALKDEYPVIVALDQIQDPQNLGAMFRVCECAGISGLLLTTKKSAHVNPLVRKISAGATEFLPFSEVSNLAQVIEYAKGKGFWVYGTSLSENSESLYSTRVHGPTLIVMGSEHSGLRRQTETLCDQLINIPQYGLLQSMNVASSAAVLLFELQRRLRYETSN